MPIAAAQPIFQTQFQAALSLGVAANPQTIATMMASGIATGVPNGLFPPPPASPVPLAPSGIEATRSGIAAALSMGISAEKPAVAKLMAQAIALAVPVVPPSGLSTLSSEIESALSMERSANQSTVSQMLSKAVVNYYLAGGVI